MSEHANKREKRLAMLVVAAVVLFTVLLIVETFRLLLPGLWSAFSAGDEQALSEYLASQGRLRSFLTLWFLAVVQVLSLVIPAMPVHHAGAAQRHHSLCRRQRGDAPEAVFSGHLHQSALPHPADLRGRQLYAGGQLAVHRADRHCAVQLCGDSVLQPHKIHRVGT